MPFLSIWYVSDWQQILSAPIVFKRGKHWHSRVTFFEAFAYQLQISRVLIIGDSALQFDSHLNKRWRESCFYL